MRILRQLGSDGWLDVGLGRSIVTAENGCVQCSRTASADGCSVALAEDAQSSSKKIRCGHNLSVHHFYREVARLGGFLSYKLDGHG